MHEHARTLSHARTHVRVYIKLGMKKKIKQMEGVNIATLKTQTIKKPARQYDVHTELFSAIVFHRADGLKIG